MSYSVYFTKEAKQCLVSAKTLLSINDQRGAINRAYYAVL